MTDRCPDAYVELAHGLADAAGDIVRGYYRRPCAVSTKPDSTPVTEADRAAERAMRTILEAAAPDHGIAGEEFGVVRGDAEYVWYLDPIDGTKAFIAGVPVFGTLIGLAREGRPVFGVIDQAVSGERWAGGAGRPCALNGERATCRRGTGLADAVLFTTSPDAYEDGDLEALERLRSAVGLTRYGADCYAFGLVAAGHADIAIECGVNDYDYCALVPVVESAGGAMTNWEGAPVTLGTDTRVIAAGDAELHRATVARLGG